MFKSVVSYFTLKYDSDYALHMGCGKMIKLYTDCYGETWMKSSRWGFVRLRYRR